jgi:hypothetical protein
VLPDGYLAMYPSGFFVSENLDKPQDCWYLVGINPQLIYTHYFMKNFSLVLSLVLCGLCAYAQSDTQSKAPSDAVVFLADPAPQYFSPDSLVPEHGSERTRSFRNRAPNVSHQPVRGVSRSTPQERRYEKALLANFLTGFAFSFVLCAGAITAARL